MASLEERVRQTKNRRIAKQILNDHSKRWKDQLAALEAIDRLKGSGALASAKLNARSALAEAPDGINPQYLPYGRYHARVKDAMYALQRALDAGDIPYE